MFKNKIDNLINQINQFEGSGSGLIIETIKAFYLKISNYDPMGNGSCIETPQHIANKKCVINIKNLDDRCFEFCILYHLNKDQLKIHPERVSKYKSIENKLKFDDIKFPVLVDDITKFERLNNISINVYSHEINKKKIIDRLVKEGKNYFELNKLNNKELLEFEYNYSKLNIFYKIPLEIYPIRITKKYVENNHANLLIISEEDEKGNINGYYTYIKNFNGLFCENKSGTNSFITCPLCLNAFYDHKNNGQKYSKEDKLIEHLKECEKYDEVKTELPVKDKFIKFKNFKNKILAPFIMTADFESLTEECSEKAGKSTHKYQKHKAISYCLKLISFDGKMDKIYKYIGEDCVEHFLKKIDKIQYKIKKFIQQTNIPYDLTNKEEEHFKNTNICHICEKEITDEKVVDHDHLTGNYRGPAHYDCNINYNLKYFSVPVIIHNLKNYDGHLIIEKIGSILKEKNEIYKKQRFNIIANNSEKYVTIQWNSLKFVDSFQFMAASLDTLSKNLTKDEKIHTLKFCSDKKYNNEQIDLLLRKGVFPYDWFNNIEKLKETKLPDKKDFYSKLEKKHISESEYKHAQKVWEKFNCKTFQDYHDLYLYVDVVLLADVFENFRKICYKNYGLDPANYLTAPSLAWDAFLKYTKVEIELIDNIDMYLMIEKGLRGGYSNIGSIRYAKANNKYLGKEYDKNIKTSYIQYEDMNNLYGWSMCQMLPLNNFKFIDVNEIDVEKILNYNENDSKGFIIECDLEYPKELHDKHNDYPLAPENINVNEKMLSKYHKKVIEDLKK